MGSASEFDVLDDQLVEAFRTHELDFDSYLFLEPHHRLVRHWDVVGNDPTYEVRLGDAISRFGTVSIWDFEKFSEAAAAAGYHIVFMDDPVPLFEWRESLYAEPPVDVPDVLGGRLDRNGEPLVTIRGFLPFQAQGINFLNSCDRACYGQWSTGTGKTLLAEGAIMLKREAGFDLTLYVNKPGNLFNAQRKLTEHTGFDSSVLLGTPTRRDRIFEEIEDGILAGDQPILIMNAEKFREDRAALKVLVEDRKVLVIFDEMPTKYANRTTALYRATAEVLYTSYSVPHQGKMAGRKIFYPKVGYDRPSEVFYLALSATSLRNSPEDIFNCVRMMDSRIFGSVTDFNNLCVAARDDWGNVVRWRNLDLMGAMYSHIVHLADKYVQPEIAAQFPQILPPETIWCDLSTPIEKLYGVLQNEYKNIGTVSVLSLDEILAAIGVLQMLVDNPRAVLSSALQHETYLDARDEFLKTNPTAAQLRAWDKKRKHTSGSRVALKLRTLVNDDAKFTDKDKNGECVVTKTNRLRELIEGHDDKVIVFSDKNGTLLPYIEEWFDLWGITYVTYHGQLSAKQRAEAEKAFRTDPEIKVFLSNDAGQDSIDLPEASLTIHYNDPWTDATKIQRGNRQHRIDSLKEAVREVTLRAPFTVEDRRAQILATKKSYQDQVNGQIVEQAEAMSKRDYLFILTGEA